VLVAPSRVALSVCNPHVMVQLPLSRGMELCVGSATGMIVAVNVALFFFVIVLREVFLRSRVLSALR
jgi:hypothetical protein